MKKLIFLLVYLLGYHIATYSQTKTFDYLQSSLSTTACNVFNVSPAVSIDGVPHASWAGGVSFNTTFGLGLSTQQKTSPFKSTAFRIDYNFGTGKSYLIKITATGNPDVLLKASVVPNVTNFVTSSQTACTLDAFAFAYNTAGYGQFSTPTTTTSTDYTITQFDIPTNGTPCQYLFIWSSGGKPALDLDVLNISKITITESPITIPISFTLAPSSTSLACGSITPVTFTVTNVNSTPGVTGYTWNLGSATNGWKLPNGTAAPQTITTNATTNSLTLTPTCGAALSSITATAAIGAANYNTNAVSVAVTQPSMSINGSSFCTGTQCFSITDLPCNATVIWAPPSPSGIVSSASSNNQLSLTKVSNGTITLTATINGVCGTNNIIRSKSIIVGTSAPTFQSYGTICSANQTFTLCANPISNSISRTWQALTSSGLITLTETNAWCVLVPANTLYVDLTVDNGCGSVKARQRITYSNCGKSIATEFTALPNPTTGDVQVDATAYIKEIQVSDKFGNTRKKIKLSSNTKKHKLNIGDLPADFYIIRIYDGKTWASKKVIKS